MFLSRAGSYAAGRQFGPRGSSFKRMPWLAVVAVAGLSGLLDLERYIGW